MPRKTKKKPDLRKRAQGYLGLLATALLIADELLKLIQLIH